MPLIDAFSLSYETNKELNLTIEHMLKYIEISLITKGINALSENKPTVLVTAVGAPPGLQFIAFSF